MHSASPITEQSLQQQHWRAHSLVAVFVSDSRSCVCRSAPLRGARAYDAAIANTARNALIAFRRVIAEAAGLLHC